MTYFDLSKINLV